MESIEEAATETVKSPMSTLNIRRNLIQRRKYCNGSARTDEETLLIRVEKHADYLKCGNGPELRKFGSMRAGPSLKKKGGAIHSRPSAAPAGQDPSLMLQVRNDLLPHAENA